MRYAGTTVELTASPYDFDSRRPLLEQEVRSITVTVFNAAGEQVDDAAMVKVPDVNMWLHLWDSPELDGDYFGRFILLDTGDHRTVQWKTIVLDPPPVAVAAP